jgi:hypothetical protein
LLELASLDAHVRQTDFCIFLHAVNGSFYKNDAKTPASCIVAATACPPLRQNEEVSAIFPVSDGEFGNKIGLK